MERDQLLCWLQTRRDRWGARRGCAGEERAAAARRARASKTRKNSANLPTVLTRPPPMQLHGMQNQPVFRGAAAAPRLSSNTPASLQPPLNRLLARTAAAGAGDLQHPHATYAVAGVRVLPAQQSRMLGTCAASRGKARRSSTRAR